MVGAVVLLIVIFSAGWVLSGSARDKAEEMAEKAAIDHLDPISDA